MTTSNVTALRELPGVDKTLFDEFMTVFRALTDDEAINLTRPLFQAPTISAYIERHQRIREVANNQWIQIFKPQLLIELRLQHLTNISEGALKPLLNVVEMYVRRKQGDTLKPSSKLGVVVNYVLQRLQALASVPNLQSALKGLGKFHEIRNAVGHSKYVFTLKTKPLSEADLLSQMEASSDTPVKKGVLELIKGVDHMARGKLLEIPLKFGKMLGLKPDLGIDKTVDRDESKIAYEGRQGDEWCPITKASPEMSFAALTQLLNDMDKVMAAGLAAIMAGVDERVHKKALDEAHCKNCNFPNMKLASTTNFECWFCATPN